MKKYSVTTAVIQFLGDSNLKECLEFVGKSGGDDNMIITLDGIKINKGDFICKGIGGKIYTCTPDDIEKIRDYEIREKFPCK